MTKHCQLKKLRRETIPTPASSALPVQAWIDDTDHRFNRERQIDKLGHMRRRCFRVGKRFVVVHWQNRHVLL